VQKDALFYPQISLDNSKLIKSMALIHDNIYRICPDNVIPEDDIDLMPLLEEGSVGKIIDPARYSRKTSEDFLDALENWDAAALTFEEQDVSLLHSQKTDQIVRDLFKGLGYREENEWLYVPAEVASNFMLFMAKEIAVNNNLALFTNSIEAWTATNYFTLNGAVDDFLQLPGHDNERLEDPYALFNMLVSELTPVNISEIPADKILAFRESRQDEIRNFRNCITGLEKEIKGTVDRDISIDRIEKKAKDLAKAQEDYKKSADFIGAKKWFGSSMMGIPASIGLCKLLSIPTASTIAIAGTGIVLGGLYSIVSSKQEVKKLNKDNPASFLIELERNFKNCARGTRTRPGGDINMTAWNCMEEYVAD